jgi:hypothetical protein
VAAPVRRIRSTLALRERDGLRAGADEAGHAGSVLDNRPGLVVQVHVHQHIAGQDPLLGLHLLAVLGLDDLLGRDDDAAEARLLRHRVDPVLEVRLDLVFVAGVGVDRVPAEHCFLSEKDVLDEPAEDLVRREQVDAGHETGDQHDGRALDQLLLAGPVDLLQLGPRLADEDEAPASRSACALTVALRLGRVRRRACGLRLALLRRAIERGAALGLGSAAGAPLGACLAGHYLVSRCRVWQPHQRQYFLNSTRSGEFRFDFSVW